LISADIRRAKHLFTKRLKEEGNKRLAHIGAMSLTSPRMLCCLCFHAVQWHVAGTNIS